MRTANRGWKIQLAIFWLLSVTGSVPALAGEEESPLVGRWQRIVSEDQSNQDERLTIPEILQFSTNGKLYMETGEEGLLVANYQLQDAGKVRLSAFDGDTIARWEVHGNQLQLQMEDETQPTRFKRKRKLFHYTSLATNSYSQVIQVDRVQLSVEITGKRATTHATYRLRNNHEDDTEAFVQLPVPEDATVVGYALEIGDQMVESVVIPKTLARTTFEEIEDRQVDPAILEMTSTGDFTTEIYPVPAGGTRIIRIDYVQTLTAEKHHRYRYRFPMDKIDNGAELDMDILFPHTRLKPTLKQSPVNRRAWKISRHPEGTRLQAQLNADTSRHSAHKPLILEFALKQENWLSWQAEGKQWLSGELEINPDWLPRDSSTAGTIALLWDTSASMEPGAQSRIDGLIGLLQQISADQTASGHTSSGQPYQQVALIPFAETSEQAVQFPLDEAGLKQLRNSLTTLNYDGATDLMAGIATLDTEQHALALLYSDGKSSYASLDRINAPVPVYPLLSTDHHNLIDLQAVAIGSHGILLDTRVMKSREIAQWVGHTQPRWSLQVNGNVILAENTIFQLDAASQQLKFAVEQAAAEMPTTSVAVIANDDNHSIRQPDIISSPMAKDNYLALALNAMQTRLHPDQQAIQDFAVEHQLVTRYTTALVLENVEDYAIYGIPPPAAIDNADDYKEIRQEIVEDESEAKASYEADLQEFLQEEWQERVQWWQNSMRLSHRELLTALAKNRTCERYNNCKPELASELVSAITAEDIGQLPDGNMEALQRSAGVAYDLEDGAVEEVMVAGIRASVALGEQESTAAINPWRPDAIYLDELEQRLAEGRESVYHHYLSQRHHYAQTPAYFMDVAQLFYRQGWDQQAFKILSNILEQLPDDISMIRMVAYNLLQAERYDAARTLFESAARQDPDEPTSARDLAIVWEKTARKSGKAQHFQQAVDHYIQAILGPWEYDETLRITALGELNHLLDTLPDVEVDASRLPSHFRTTLDTDLRVVASWNSRNADIDLHVLEPSGEIVFYSNRTSAAFGYLPYDDVDGFGPEEYLTRFALPGTYEFMVHYFGGNTVEIFGPVSLTLDLYRNYGRTTETLETTTVRLQSTDETIDIGKITFQ